MASQNSAALLRHRLFIDSSVQGSLLRRAALYSFSCMLYFLVILIFTETMADSDQTIGQILLHCLDEAIYWAPGLILLAPLVAYDLLRFSNRFAGPIFRLRREMQRLVDGESIHPLRFRDDDYWNEMADLFNQIRGEMQALRQFKEGGSNPSLPGAASRAKKLFDENDPTPVDDFITVAAGEKS